MFYIYDFCKGLCLFRGVVHLVVVMLQLLYIWYIMTFVCKDSTQLVGQVECLYMLGVGHLDIMCFVHVSHVWCYYSYMLELFIGP